MTLSKSPEEFQGFVEEESKRWRASSRKTTSGWTRRVREPAATALDQRREMLVSAAAAAAVVVTEPSRFFDLHAVGSTSPPDVARERNHHEWGKGLGWLPM